MSGLNRRPLKMLQADFDRLLKLTLAAQAAIEAHEQRTTSRSIDDPTYSKAAAETPEEMPAQLGSPPAPNSEEGIIEAFRIIFGGGSADRRRPGMERVLGEFVALLLITQAWPADGLTLDEAAGVLGCNEKQVRRYIGYVEARTGLRYPFNRKNIIRVQNAESDFGPKVEKIAS